MYISYLAPIIFLNYFIIAAAKQLLSAAYLLCCMRAVCLMQSEHAAPNNARATLPRAAAVERSAQYI